MQIGEGASGASSTDSGIASASRPRDAKTGRSRSARGKRRPLDEDDARRQLSESKKLYYRIGEVSELTGVKAHVLRYWETEFRWMAPPKSRSKQRLYRKRDIEFVWLLKKLLWDQRYTIAGARQRIQELGLDEALTRCADDASLLSGVASIAGLAGPEAEPSAGRAARPAPVFDGAAAEGADVAEGAQGSDSFDRDAEGGARPDWTGLAVALESMQSELLELRGALQQGL